MSDCIFARYSVYWTFSRQSTSRPYPPLNVSCPCLGTPTRSKYFLIETEDDNVDNLGGQGEDFAVPQDFKGPCKKSYDCMKKNTCRDEDSDKEDPNNNAKQCK